MKTTMPNTLFTAIFLLGLPLADAEVVSSGESGVVRAAGNPSLNALMAKGSENANAADANAAEGEKPAASNENEQEKSATIDENEIPFYCTLDVVFFDGHGLEPKGTEVKTLVKKTEEWIATVLEPDDTFEKLSIDDDFTTAYDMLVPDNFSMKFSAHAQVKDLETMTIDDVADMVTSANYEEYIEEFLWLSVPLKMNVLYQTHAVNLSCHPGARPANEEARRLRGSPSTGFGGSHMAARNDA